MVFEISITNFIFTTFGFIWAAEFEFLDHLLKNPTLLLLKFMLAVWAIWLLLDPLRNAIFAIWNFTLLTDNMIPDYLNADLANKVLNVALFV